MIGSWRWISLCLIGILLLPYGISIESETSYSHKMLNTGCFGVNTQIPGVDGAFAVVATDDIGGVYVAYQSLMEIGGNYFEHVHFTYSHDYGSSWCTSFRVNDNDSSSVVCDSPSIAVDPTSGDVFVAWKDNRTGLAKVYVSKSVDRGVTFGSDGLFYDWFYDEDSRTLQIGNLSGASATYQSWITSNYLRLRWTTPGACKLSLKFYFITTVDSP